MPSLKIPESALSVLETDVFEVYEQRADYDLEPSDERTLQIIVEYVDLERGRLAVPLGKEEREALAEAFTDLANLLDDNIEHGHSIDVKFDSAALRGFSTLSSKIRHVGHNT